MAWGPAYRNDFVDLSEVTIYDSHTALGSLTDTPSGGAALQSPRLPSNVQIVTDASATPDAAGRQTLARVYSRLAGSGEYKGGGYWSNGGFMLDKGKQLYGDYTIRVRTQYGKNTKGVLLLWPVGPNGWRQANPGTGDETDFYEWYTFSTIDNSAGATNLHFRAADGTTKPSYQWHIPLGISDWSVWHELHLVWEPGLLDLFVDGVRPHVAANQHNYPVTNPLVIPAVPMYLAVQTAMLGQRDTAVTTRTTHFIDIDYAIIKPYVNDGSVTISDPSNVTLTTLDSVSQRLTWTPAVASDGSPVISKIEIEHPSGAGNWVVEAPALGTANLLIQGLSPNTQYRARVTSSTSSGSATSSSVLSNAATTSASGTTINASVHATSAGGPAIGPIPLPVHFDFADCSGSFSAATLDPDDGTNPITLTVTNPGTSTAAIAALDYVYTTTSEPGIFQPTLTLVDSTGAISDSDTDAVTTTAGSDDATDLLKLPYPKVDDDLSVGWARRVLDQIDAAAGNAVSASAVYGSSADVVQQMWTPNSDYPIRIETVADLFKGDGTYDPLTTTGLFAQAFSGSTPPPPTGTTSFYQPVTVDTDPTAAVSSRVVTLPTGIVAGSYCLIGVHVFDATTRALTTPAGWTLIDGPLGNGNGNSTLRVYGKPVTTTDSGGTVTLAFGTGTQILAIAGGVYKNATGIDATTGPPAGHVMSADPSTAQTVLATPIITSGAASEMAVAFAGAKGSANGGFVINAPTTGSNQRMQDTTAVSGAKNVGIVMWDNGLRVSAGAGDLGSARSGGMGLFGVAWAGALTHP